MQWFLLWRFEQVDLRNALGIQLLTILLGLTTNAPVLEIPSAVQNDEAALEMVFCAVPEASRYGETNNTEHV